MLNDGADFKFDTTLPTLPCLPFPLQLRVGTTGQGMFAQWHLRTVEVTHLASGASWVFDCHDWIDKKCNWQRVLTAQRRAGVM